MKNKISIPVLLSGVVVLSIIFWNLFNWFVDYQLERQTRIQQEKAQGEARILSQEQELNQLKKQLLDLKNKPSESKSNDNITNIVKKWGKRIAYLECIPFYDNYTVTGSATIIGGEAGDIPGTAEIFALTNAHVITDNNGYAMKTCKILVNNEKVYTVTNSPGNIKMNVGKNGDWATIVMPKDEYLSFLTAIPFSNCVENNSYNVEIGDKIIVLGYPSIGSENGLTVTDGIISGIEDKYYVTSAKIDHGNSGGAALRVKDGCYLGLPTSSVVGSIESLGRILKAGVLFEQ